MLEHKYRTFVIALLFLVVLGAVIYFHATDSGEGFRERLEGMLALLLPALMDSGMEQRKRTRASLPGGQ